MFKGKDKKSAPAEPVDQKPSVIELVDKFIKDAYELQSSDIHINPAADNVRVRYRVDGVLRNIENLPKEQHSEVVSRIKILSGLRTDEHQMSQDGRFRTKVGGKQVDVRVSVVPSYYGENIVLRLLADKEEDFTLASLGFGNKDIEKIKKAIKKPSGMILVTGPTGSGKTTTLYTLIKMLNNEGVAIVTIEDPIEYAIENIEQIQVNPRRGLTFATGLRSILRQDPNIIMVGEIRDTETAGIAVNTALTGHLLLSTLHTNDSVSTLPRLLDMGIESYLVASTVSLVIGQRLVRKICSDCKEEREVTEGERESLAEVLRPELLGDVKKFYHGKGCDSCLNSGYKGRVVINEILVSDDDIHELILKKASVNEIRRAAIKNGMTQMIEDGFNKVKDGVTTMEEVLRVVHE